MAGLNDRVHGYNPVYRDPALNPLTPQFASFPFLHGRPGQFVGLRVNQVTAPVAPLQYRLDHQGHIVPQNIMNSVLDDIMLDMSSVCANPANVNTYIGHAPHNATWLAAALAYGIALNIPMFDFGPPHIPLTGANRVAALARAEARVGDLFAIVTWNPVNLCRAPADQYRNGVPGDAIDATVLAWLNLHPLGVDANWLAAANTLLAQPNPSAAQVRTYLAASTATLPGQQHHPTGFYRFNWDAGLLPT